MSGIVVPFPGRHVGEGLTLTDIHYTVIALRAHARADALRRLAILAVADKLEQYADEVAAFLPIGQA